MIEMNKLFPITFGIIVCIRSLSLHEYKKYLPYTELYVFFLFFWLMMIVFNKKKVALSFKAVGNKSVLLLSLFYLFWGLTAIPEARHDSIPLMFRCFLSIIFIVVSIFWIQEYKCFDNVIYCCYVSMSSLLFILVLLYFKQIDIIGSLRNFWISEEWLRIRARFGLPNNIAAEYAMATILLSIYLLNTRYRKHTYKRLLVLLNDFLMVIIIIANNSRGTAIAGLVVIFVYLIIKSLRDHKIKKLLNTGKWAFIIICSYVIYASIVGKIDVTQLLEGTNRSHFLKNLLVLKNSGRWLIGLGNISGEFFENKNFIYGAETDYMEVGYIGFFVTGGIIGTVILLYIIFDILRNMTIYNTINHSKLGRWLLLVFCYMLFLNLFEGYLFSSTYITSIVFLILILSYLNCCYKGAFEKIE